MKRLIIIILIVMLAFPSWVLVSANGAAGDTNALDEARKYYKLESQDNGPITKTDGTAFRVCYVDIDPYPATGEILYYFIAQLAKEGWISLEEELPFDPSNTDAKELISYLASRDIGPYLKFSDDASYYISDEYDGVSYTKKHIKKQIDRGEIDIIFCLGTWPADMLINDMGIREIPIMVSGTVDPVASGIVDGDEYSGRTNIWCHTNRGVYRNQMKFYHDVSQFQNIGMVFYDEAIGSYGPYSESAKENGFTITYKKIDRPSVMDEAYYNMLKAEYKALVDKGIDAFLLNADMIRDEDQVEKLLEVFYEKNIPVFVQTSEYFVKDGATMIVTAVDSVTLSVFLADTLKKILHGAKPEELIQEYATPPFLSINLDVTDRIGLPISSDTLRSAENIYSKKKN